MGSVEQIGAAFKQGLWAQKGVKSDLLCFDLIVEVVYNEPQKETVQPMFIGQVNAARDDCRPFHVEGWSRFRGLSAGGLPVYAPE